MPEVCLVLNDGIAGFNPATDGVIRFRYTGTLSTFAIVPCGGDTQPRFPPPPPGP
jgi:hypothetical protein